MYYYLIVITIKMHGSVFIYKKIVYVTYTIFKKLFLRGHSKCTAIGFYLSDRFVKRHEGLPDSKLINKRHMRTYAAKIKENGLLSVCNAMKSVKPYPYQRLTGLIKLFLQITLIRLLVG